MKWLKRKWSYDRLAAFLEKKLPKDEYTVLSDEQGIGVKAGSMLIAYIELSPDRREAALSFNVRCWPARASELTLAMCRQIRTYVDVFEGFDAKTMDELRGNGQVH